jgi:hypothetical protein
MTLNSADGIRKMLKDGGRDRTRTCDLLRVNQTVPPNSMITEQIFSCKVGIRFTQVAPLCWGLVFALVRVG